MINLSQLVTLIDVFLQIRTTRTVPIIVGKIQKFYLHGSYEEDEVFATGGEMEIMQVVIFD